MTELFAQPYNPGIAGFYFRSVECFQRHTEGLTDIFGQPVEECEIQFIDGEDIDAALFEALRVHPGTLDVYFNAVNEWSVHEKVQVIIAVGECGYSFGPDSKPDDFDVPIYEMDSLKELAWYYVDEGLFGDIPSNIQCYLDMDAIAHDLGTDYSEITIAGQHYIYRCG